MLERLFQRHLEDDEPLYLVIHKHWVFNIREFAPPVLSIVATWFVIYFAPIPFVAIAMLILDALLIVWLLQHILDYYLDALLITDRAIIDVEWCGWFHRTSTRIEYASIEGVSYEIKGMFGTLLNYGTLTIERIGNGSIVSIENVKRPRDVESAILACQTECLRTRNLKDSAAVKDIIAEIVSERMHMRELEGDDEDIAYSQ